MAKSLNTENLVSVGEPVKITSLTGLVTIVSTGKTDLMKKGTEYELPVKAAETLINKGFAILKK